MLLRGLKTLLVMGLLTGLVGAQPEQRPTSAGARWTQLSCNLQLDCQDLNAAAVSLESLAAALGAEVSSLNVDESSGQGNANLRVPRAKLDQLLSALPKVGHIVQQNRNSSDYTSSYIEQRRQLAQSEKMLRAHWVAQGVDLTPEERATAELEIQRFLTDRLRSARSNLETYQGYQTWAEVSIRLTTRAPRRVANENTPATQAAPPAGTAPNPAPPAAAPSGAAVWKLPMLSAFLVLCLIYFLVTARRRSA